MLANRRRSALLLEQAPISRAAAYQGGWGNSRVSTSILIPFNGTNLSCS